MKQEAKKSKPSVKTKERIDRHLSVTEAASSRAQVKDAFAVQRLIKADVQLLERCARLGLTDVELGYVFGVSAGVVKDAKTRYESFRMTLEKGRSSADADVVDSLFSLARGYTYDEVTREAVPVKQADGSIQYEMRITKIVGKRVIGNVLACMAWLNNRQADRWRAKQPDMPDGGEAKVEELGSVSLQSELDAIFARVGISAPVQISEGTK